MGQKSMGEAAKGGSLFLGVASGRFIVRRLWEWGRFVPKRQIISSTQQLGSLAHSGPTSCRSRLCRDVVFTEHPGGAATVKGRVHRKPTASALETTQAGPRRG